MFDSTNVAIREGDSSSSAQSTAKAVINSPIAVKPANDETRFIRIKNSSEEAKTLFSFDKPYFIKSVGIHRSKEYDLTEEYAKKTYVKIHQIVCYGDFMLIEISEIGFDWIDRLVHSNGYDGNYSDRSYGKWSVTKHIPDEILNAESAS